MEIRMKDDNDWTYIQSPLYIAVFFFLHTFASILAFKAPTHYSTNSSMAHDG
jgi:hypothetical protein